ncbi:MAG: hypothetical protein IID41_07985 [Planctomycetes bacterium]|nr:hypothetical protein [Planctomycetota bacterium]
MSGPKFNLSDVTRDADVVAAVVSAHEAFGLLNRSLDLPPYWAALVTTEHGETQVCAPGSEVDGRDVEEVMLVRTSPLRLAYAFNQLDSEDGFSCDAAATLDVQVVVDGSELAAFRKHMVGGERRVVVDDVQAALQSPIREVLARFVKSRSAADLVDTTDLSGLQSELEDALQGPLFKLGLRFEGLHGASVDSRTYRQASRERNRLQRERRQQDLRSQLRRAIEQAQDERLAHVRELLERARVLAEESPQADLAEVLKTFDAAQRGELYEALWADDISQGGTRWLVVVCGLELLYFDPAAPEQPVRRTALETAVGPLRSIAYHRSADDTPVLGVGAAGGVLLVHAESGDLLGTYPAGSAAGRRVRGGFNSVALAGEFVLGAHSELGLWRWLIDKPDSGSQLLPEVTAGAQTVRHVQFSGGRVFVAVDSQVYSIRAACDQAPVIYEGSRETITALLCDETRLYAGTADGRILCWPMDDPASAETLQAGAGRAVESIGRLRTGGVERLLFTDTSSAVHAQVVGDAFRCRYEAGGQTIRRAEFAPDWIVGTNETRDRLFCWPTGRPASPPTVLPVAQLSGRSIQDVCLVPRSIA